MTGPGRTSAVPVSAPASTASSQDIYRRHAVALYRQALLAPDGPARSGRAARDILVNERALAAIPERGPGDAPSSPASGQSRRWPARRAMRQG